MELMVFAVMVPEDGTTVETVAVMRMPATAPAEMAARFALARCGAAGETPENVTNDCDVEPTAEPSGAEPP